MRAQYVFMDLSTYEETRLGRDEAWAKWLKEGMEAQLLKWNDRVISVDLQKNVELQVTETDPGVKGNTASGGFAMRCMFSGFTTLRGCVIYVDLRIRTWSWLSRRPTPAGSASAPGRLWFPGTELSTVAWDCGQPPLPLSSHGREIQGRCCPMYERMPGASAAVPRQSTQSLVVVST